MAWQDDAIRGSDADPFTPSEQMLDSDLFLDPWAEPAYVRAEDAE